ncbi:MAG: PRC-barrel domain-containing protein [Armatimonadetes bacterium]|nr:PRC-barrel domain-containing protein [Armatimonadota bacterium]
MREIDRCLGLPVIAMDTAEETGITSHIVTDPVANRVIGFVVSGPNAASPKRAFLIGDVVTYGDDVVLVQALDCVRPLAQVPEITPFLIADQERLHRTAMTSDGERVGRIIDHAFDEANGQVVSYRFEPGGGGEAQVIPSSAMIVSSKGLALFHREALPVPASQEEQPAYSAVAAGVEEETRIPIHLPPERERVPVGPRAAVAEMQFHAPPPAPARRPSHPYEHEYYPAEEREAPRYAPTASDAPRDRSEADEETEEETPEAIQKFLPLLVGALVSRDIRNDTGETIIHKGEEVTRSVVEAAWRVNRLYDLYIAAQAPAQRM